MLNEIVLHGCHAPSPHGTEKQILGQTPNKKNARVELTQVGGAIGLPIKDQTLKEQLVSCRPLPSIIATRLIKP